MTYTNNNQETGIQSVNMQPALPRTYYVDLFDDNHKRADQIDMEKLEEEADAAAVRHCVERRAHRATRADKLSRKAAR